MKTKVWEILVPATSNTGEEFTVAHHHEWDDFVNNLTGGLTIMKSVKGKWVDSKSAKDFSDIVIPCRIACSRKKIEKIVDFTIMHYEQKAVYAYKVSKTVIIRYEK
jgi:hypothetical protein